MFAHSSHIKPLTISNKVQANRNRPHIMGLIDVFAKFHGKEKWSELEPWQKFIVGIELMLLPITLLILGDMLAGLL